MVSYIFQVTAAGSVSRRHAAGHGERKWPSVEVSPRPVDPPFDQVSEVHGHLDGTIFQYENCSPKVIKHATGLFNETSDELISVLRLDNADSVVGQWDMSEICDFVYRCSLETVFAVVTEQRLGVLRSVPAVDRNNSSQTEEDVKTNRQYIT